MDQFIRNYENFPKPGSKMNQIDRNENFKILKIPTQNRLIISKKKRNSYHVGKPPSQAKFTDDELIMNWLTLEAIGRLQIYNSNSFELIQ